MKRPLSQLIHTNVQTGDGSPRIITLHGYNQYARDVNDYGLAASPSGRVIGLESYKGVFLGQSIVGYTWFVGPQDRPSPLFFGDALAEIERFLWDEIDRQDASRAELPFLVGIEQGAIMALAAAAAVPDLLSGVIAIDGSLPIVPGWSPPLAPLANLPILLLNAAGSEQASPTVLRGERLSTTLGSWGADVTRSEIPGDALPANVMSSWIATQAVRFHLAGGDDS